MLELITSARTLLIIASTVLSVVFLLKGVLLMIKHSRNANDPDASISRIARMFIASAALVNIITVGQIMVYTITGSDSVCGMVEQVDVSYFTDEPESCLDITNTEFADEEKIHDLLGEERTQAIKAFVSRVAVFFMLIQTIGLYYFIKAFCLLVSISNGQSDLTYSRVLIMMIFSAIALDLKATLVIIANTFAAIIS